MHGVRYERTSRAPCVFKHAVKLTQVVDQDDCVDLEVGLTRGGEVARAEHQLEVIVDELGVAQSCAPALRARARAQLNAGGVKPLEDGVLFPRVGAVCLRSVGNDADTAATAHSTEQGVLGIHEVERETDDVHKGLGLVDQFAPGDQRVGGETEGREGADALIP